MLYVSDPLTPEQFCAEEAGGRRSSRWSNVPPTLGQDLHMGIDAPPYYVVDPVAAWRDSYLVSWVPPSLIPLAHTGVVGQILDCIEWLADRDTSFTRALDELHLLV